jgi:hypothetical protein
MPEGNGDSVSCMLRLVESPGLLDRAGGRGKGAIRVRTDQANRTNHQHKNYGEHHRVFRDVLAAFVEAEPGEEIKHDTSFLNNELFLGWCCRRAATTHWRPSNKHMGCECGDDSRGLAVESRLDL